MNKEAVIWNKIRELQDEYMQLNYYVYRDSIGKIVIDKLKNNQYKTGIIYVSYGHEYKTLDEFDDEANSIKELVREAIKENRQQVKSELDNKLRMEHLLNNIKELKELLWPPFCQSYPHKKIIDTIRLPYKTSIADEVKDCQMGVYFLWGKLGLEYIGQSRNISLRFKGHEYFKIQYHIVGIIPIDDDHIRIETEEYLIRNCNPLFNRVFGNYGQYLLDNNIV